MTRRHRLRRIVDSRIVRPLLFIVGLFVLWEVVIDLFRIPPYLIPAPLAVVKLSGKKVPAGGAAPLWMPK